MKIAVAIVDLEHIQHSYYFIMIRWVCGMALVCVIMRYDEWMDTASPIRVHTHSPRDSLSFLRIHVYWWIEYRAYTTIYTRYLPFTSFRTATAKAIQYVQIRAYVTMQRSSGNGVGKRVRVHKMWDGQFKLDTSRHIYVSVWKIRQRAFKSAPRAHHRRRRRRALDNGQGVHESS